MGNIDESSFDKYYIDEGGFIKLNPSKEKSEKKYSAPIKANKDGYFVSDDDFTKKEVKGSKLSERKYWDEWNDDGLPIRHYLEPGETERESRKKVKEEKKRKEREERKKREEEKKKREKEEKKRKEEEKRKKEENKKRAREEQNEKKSDSNSNNSNTGNNSRKISILTGDGVTYYETTAPSSNSNTPKEKNKPTLLGDTTPKGSSSSKSPKPESPDKKDTGKSSAKLEIEKEGSQKPRKDVGITIL